jgi:hypothetical protein
LFNLGTAVVVVRWARRGRCGTSATAAQESSAVARMACLQHAAGCTETFQTSSF